MPLLTFIYFYTNKPGLTGPEYSAMLPMGVRVKGLSQRGQLSLFSCWTRLDPHAHGTCTLMCLWKPQPPGDLVPFQTSTKWHVFGDRHRWLHWKLSSYIDNLCSRPWRLISTKYRSTHAMYIHIFSTYNQYSIIYTHRKTIEKTLYPQLIIRYRQIHIIRYTYVISYNYWLYINIQYI